MKYQPPFGRESEGDSAQYVNGNPVEGRQGSIPPAATFEYPMREIVAVISKSKIAPSDTDLMQLAKGVRSQALNYAQDTGSANQLSVSFDPPLGTYTLGLPIKVKVAATNTGPATIDAGGSQGRVAIINMKGASLEAGDLPGGGVAEMIFNGTVFQLVNFLGQGGGTGGGAVTTYQVNIPYAADVGTVNIIDATFTSLPPTYVLKAGDPFLVKIKNTNSGSAIARFRTSAGALADQPIRANGGGSAPLLQGDLAADDVVLFIYDGTQFWIQPNPLISANVQINIPSQYATPEAALLAIRRKTIAQNALVTLYMAKNAGPINDAVKGIVGGYNPFTINHNNSDRILVRGEMKIAGNLTGPMFAQTGNRPADSANNISMLRTRFGVEIVVGATGPAVGIENVGPGRPAVQDILITGPNYWSGNGIAQWMGVNVTGQINCTNVSAWGLDAGFYGGGMASFQYCFATGCFRHGFFGTSGAQFGLANSGAFGGSLNGVSSSQGAVVNTYMCWSNYNANAGVYSGDFAEMTWHTSQAIGNGYSDIFAGPLGYIALLQSGAGGGYGTASPTPGTLGVYANLIILG